MTNLTDIAVYLHMNYPYPSELSKARMVKMLYLIDWKASIDLERQITNTDWVFNHYGPYVPEIIDLFKRDDRFEISSTTNSYGESKELIELVKKPDAINIPAEEKSIVDFVINICKPLRWDEFIKLVYSTYPILVSSKFSRLNLVELAKEYKSEEELPVQN